MIISMRTTIDLTDEAYQIAKGYAHDRRETLSKVVSDLILKGAKGTTVPPGEIRMVNGWPVVSVGRPVTSEEIADFLAQDE